MHPRRALLRNASLALLLLAPAAAFARTPGSIELEQIFEHSYATGDGSTPVTFALPGPVVQGDLIYLALVLNPLESDVLSITDSKGNNYQAAFQLEAGFGDWQFGVFFAIAQSTGPVTVSLATTSFQVLDVHLLVYSGVKRSNPIRDSSRGSDGSNLDMTCDLATNEPGELLVAFMPSWGFFQSVGPGATVRSNLNGDLVMDKVATFAGSHAMTAITDAAPWWAQCVAFRREPLVAQADSGVGGTVGDGGTDGGVSSPVGGLVQSPLASNLGCSATQNVLSLTGIVLVLAALMRGGRRRSR